MARRTRPSWNVDHIYHSRRVSPTAAHVTIQRPETVGAAVYVEWGTQDFLEFSPRAAREIAEALMAAADAAEAQRKSWEK